MSRRFMSALGRVFSFGGMEPRPRGRTPLLLRRNMLMGLGGASLALPLFHSLGCSDSSSREAGELGKASLAENGFPKRIMVVYTPNGNFQYPTSLDLAGTQYEALAPYKSKLVMMSGVAMPVHDNPPGEQHQQGMALLTGRRLNMGSQVGGDGSLAGWGSGPSIDQEIADVVGVMTPRKSLQLGVQSTNYGGTEVRTVISYKGSDQPNANETSPQALYNDVFASLGADPLGVAQLKGRRKSVLDLVGKQYDGLAPKMSANDKQKLEQHLDAIREMEQRLEQPEVVLGGFCQKPDPAPGIDTGNPASFPQIGKLFMDMSVMAFACDITRVITFQWSASTNNRPYPWLQYDAGDGAGPKPITDDEHSLGHMPDADIHAWGKLNVIRHWYGEQFAYLLSKLEEVKEGDGTLLDNTVVLFASEISRGNTHSHKNMPFVLAGSAGGYLKTGQYLTFNEESHSNLLVSLLNALGLPHTTWGEPDYCTGPLFGLT